MSFLYIQSNWDIEYCTRTFRTVVTKGKAACILPLRALIHLRLTPLRFNPSCLANILHGLLDDTHMPC